MSPSGIKDYFIYLFYKDGIDFGAPYKETADFDDDEKEDVKAAEEVLLNAIIENYDLLCDMDEKELFSVWSLDDEEDVCDGHPLKDIYYALFDLSNVLPEQ